MVRILGPRNPVRAWSRCRSGSREPFSRTPMNGVVRTLGPRNSANTWSPCRSRSRKPFSRMTMSDRRRVVRARGPRNSVNAWSRCHSRWLYFHDVLDLVWFRSALPLSSQDPDHCLEGNIWSEPRRSCGVQPYES